MSDPMDDPMPDPQTDPSFEDLSDLESSEEEVDHLFTACEDKEEIKTKVMVDSHFGSHSDNSNKNSKKFPKRVLKKDQKKVLKKKPKKYPKKELKKDLVCSECHPNRHFKKQNVLDLHKNVLHDSFGANVCLWCAKRFFTKNQLVVHQTLYAHNTPID